VGADADFVGKKSFFKNFVSKVGNVFQKKKKGESPNSVNGSSTPKSTSETVKPNAKQKQDEEHEDVFQIEDEEEDQDGANNVVEEYLSDEEEEKLEEDKEEKKVLKNLYHTDDGIAKSKNERKDNDEQKSNSSTSKEEINESDDGDEEYEEEDSDYENDEKDQDSEEGDQVVQIHRIMPRGTLVDLSEWRVYRCKKVSKKKNFFSKLVAPFETRLLAIDDLNFYVMKFHEKKIGFAYITNLLDLRRLFRCDYKISENTIEIFLHLFNENFNPKEAAVTKKYIFGTEKDRDHIRFVKKLEYSIKTHSLPAIFHEI